MLIRMKNITKTFGPLVANDKVNLTLEEGEILAVVGENGAGKSTLMKILYGLQRADDGEIYIRDKAVVFRTPPRCNKERDWNGPATFHAVLTVHCV